MDQPNVKMLRALTQVRLKQNDGKLDVIGISMEPLIYQGDQVQVTPQQQYRIGDIIVFIDILGNLLVHRILEIKGNYIITKGDNTVSTDKSLAENCLGKVTKIYRSDGRGNFRPVKAYSRLSDKGILWLSKRMNQKLRKGIPPERIFNAWERRLMLKLAGPLHL